MIKGGIEADDIETLAQILEHEKKSHSHKRSLCFFMFIISLASLVIALIVIAVRLAVMSFASDGAIEISSQFLMLQFLAPLAAVALSFFGAWWAVQNCLNSIERTLFAARNQRLHLFTRFLEQIQCADKEKRRAWLEILKSAVM
jgi:hypothetical protein